MRKGMAMEPNDAEAENLVLPDEWDDPFISFSEWASDEDEAAFADL